jgi:K+-sensing histidine kinase KdpD
VQKRIIGVLFVYHDREHEFTENEIEMLSLFANQAALAIENASQRKKLEIMEAVAWMGIEFSDMAHDIDGKVAACKREINYLLSVVKNPPKTVEALEDLKEYHEEIGKIPRRTLLPFRPKPDVVPFNEALRDGIKKWILPEEKVSLRFSGQMTANINVYINRQLLGVVLKILTNNAVRATWFTANKRLSVKVTTKSDRVVVTMSNGGTAIPLKIQKRLFKEPISKSQGASGTGVGLLIAKSVLLGSGGDIEFVKSNHDETTFSFYLPLLTAERPDRVETEKALS